MNHHSADVIVNNKIVTKNIADLSKEDDYAVIRLDLRWLKLQEIPFVSSYLNLEELQLDGNQITDIDPNSTNESLPNFYCLINPYDTGKKELLIERFLF